MNRIVVYFSATGTTKNVGEKIAKRLNADTHEIKPVTPYTDADLNWMDKKSRSTLEMKDKSSRPEIIKDDLDLSQYDEILIGFPVWWYTCPTIVATFVESFDFSNKKIVLWGTSGSSGLGSTKKDLAKCTSAEIVDGRIIHSDKDIDKLIESLDK